jgi:hypothetical protein
MKEAQKDVREYLAAIGRRGGLASRRELTRSHAKQMVAIREAKRAALKASVGRAANITTGRGHAWEGGRAPRSGIEESRGLRVIGDCSSSPDLILLIARFIISRLRCMKAAGCWLECLSRPRALGDASVQCLHAAQRLS